MKGKNGQKWAQKSAFVVRETKAGVFAAFKRINCFFFSCQIRFCDSLDSELALDLVVHGLTCLVKKGAQQVDGGKEKHLSE